MRRPNMSLSRPCHQTTPQAVNRAWGSDCLEQLVQIAGLDQGDGGEFTVWRPPHGPNLGNHAKALLIRPATSLGSAGNGGSVFGNQGI